MSKDFRSRREASWVGMARRERIKAETTLVQAGVLIHRMAKPLICHGGGTS